MLNLVEDDYERRFSSSAQGVSLPVGAVVTTENGKQHFVYGHTVSWKNRWGISEIRVETYAVHPDKELDDMDWGERLKYDYIVALQV